MFAGQLVDGFLKVEALRGGFVLEGGKSGFEPAPE